MSGYTFQRIDVWVLGVCFAVGLAAWSANVQAAPSSGEPVIVRQPDGTTFVAVPGGDERVNWVSHEGFLIAQDEAGWWKYANLKRGEPEPGTALVGIDHAPAEAATLADISAWAASARRSLETTAAPPPAKGRSTTESVLVVLVTFQDRPLTTTDAYWSNFFFGTSGKTVRTYYNEVSGGNYDIVPAAETEGTAADGVVRVTLQLTDHNNGNHPDPYGIFDDRVRWIVSDALYHTAAYVQYATFDTQAPTGYVTPDELHIVFVVAGYDHGYAGALSLHPAIHSHRWCLYGTVPSPVIGGVALCGWYGDNRDSGYCQIGELHGDAGGSHSATVGPTCHELAHDLGLPDLYDYTAASQGIGAWGLMGYGCWGTASSDTYLGETPVHPCAWSKAQLQFVTPTVMSGTQDCTLRAAGTAAYTVVKMGTSDPNQCFLIENRQLQGFDAGLYRWFSRSTGGTGGGGLAIWHIDDSIADNNNWSHKMVDLEEANQNNWTSGELDTMPANPLTVQANRRHLYYAGQVSAFGDAMPPSSRLYGMISTYINVTSVSAAGSVMKCYLATILNSQLVWSTFFGAASDEKITGVALDYSGDVYVCGQAGVSGIPTTPGAFDTNRLCSQPSFVAKFGSSGNLVWSTLLETNSGHGTYAEAIANDGYGFAFVTGFTGLGHPTTTGAWDTTYGGNSDAFVTKFDQAGSTLVYSTYLGGSGQDKAYAIALGWDAYAADWQACVVGETNTSDFPETLSTAFGGGIDTFVTSFDTTGSGLLYSRFLGGSSADYGYGISLDAQRNVYLTGITYSSDFPTTAGAFDTVFSSSNAFFTMLAANGIMSYGSFLGTTVTGYDVTWDSLGILIAGQAFSIPTTSGAYSQSYKGGTSDAFVTKFDPTPSAPLMFSTYLGGSVADEAYALVMDPTETAAYVVGDTSSDDFPTLGAYAASRAGGKDAFATALRSDGATLLCSTYLGGSADDQANDVTVYDRSAVYVIGQTNSSNFPTTPGAYDTSFNGGMDGFIAKLSFDQITASMVVCVPDGGEQWEQGQPVSIQWSSTGAGTTVDIELSRNGAGGPWELLFNDTTNDGVESWTVSGSVSWDCLIRITGSGSPTLTDTSNGSFAIIYLRGDLDGDQDVDLSDATILIAVLLGTDTNPNHVARADINGDLMVDGLDVQSFTDEFL